MENKDLNLLVKKMNTAAMRFNREMSKLARKINKAITNDKKLMRLIEMIERKEG